MSNVRPSNGSIEEITPTLNLKVGDWVVIRPAQEILGTLDQSSCLDQLPFMPQMLKYCGKAFKVRARAHKLCDTVFATGGRRMTNAVFLDGLSCDGGAFGGCEMACSIVWKESWLKRADGLKPDDDAGTAASTSALDALAWKSCRRASPDVQQTDPIYICQATKMPEATTLLPWWSPDQYVVDYRSGNAPLSTTLARLMFRAYTPLVSSGVGLGSALRWLYNAIQRLRGGVPFPVHAGRLPAGGPTPATKLDLQPGDLVRVKSVEQIMETVDTNLFNRGMSFAPEMVPYCGKTYRVKQRLHKIINEKTGRLTVLKNSCLVLDGVECHGRYSNPINCPRGMPPYWREIWLERVDSEATGKTAGRETERAPVKS